MKNQFKSPIESIQAEQVEQQENSELEQLRAEVAALREEKAYLDVYFGQPDTDPAAYEYFLPLAKEAGIKPDSAAIKAFIQNLQANPSTGEMFRANKGSGNPQSQQQSGVRLVHPDDLKHLREMGIDMKDVNSGKVKVSRDVAPFQPFTLR